MQRPSLTSLRRVGAILAVMLAALVLTTLAVAALEGALRIPDASATYLLAVVSVAVVVRHAGSRCHRVRVVPAV